MEHLKSFPPQEPNSLIREQTGTCTFSMPRFPFQFPVTQGGSHFKIELTGYCGQTIALFRRFNPSSNVSTVCPIFNPQISWSRLEGSNLLHSLSAMSITQEQYDSLLFLVQNLTEKAPSCENSNFDTGNTAWILVSTSIVLLMTLPGCSYLRNTIVPLLR